jgi:hypothetical protein
MRLDPTLIGREIDNLLAQYPELADDEQLRHDMIEGETEAFTLLSVLLRRHGSTKALAAGTKEYAADISERAARLSRRTDAYRTLIKRLMEHAKLRKKELPEGTISIGKGRDSLVIADDAAVPEWFCIIPPPIPDKARIKRMIEDGIDVEWAAIVTGDDVLTIRSK